MSTTVVQQQSFPVGQHQPSVIQLQTVRSHTTTTGNGQYPAYNLKAAVTTGILQISCGSLLVVLGVAALGIGSLYRSAWNIWGGICFYVVAGILGVVSKNQSRCIIISYMVMSIISAICAGGQLIYDSIAASVQANYCFHLLDAQWDPYQCHSDEGVVIVHALAAVVGFVEMVVAIVASAYCYCGSCGAEQNTVIHYAQPYSGGQVTIVTPGATYASGPAVINPSQSYGIGPFQAPQYTGQMGEPIGQPLSPPAPPPNHPVHFSTTSAPCPEQLYSHPMYSPPAYSYTQPASSVPVPLEPRATSRHCIQVIHHSYLYGILNQPAVYQRAYY